MSRTSREVKVSNKISIKKTVNVTLDIHHLDKNIDKLGLLWSIFIIRFRRDINMVR